MEIGQLLVELRSEKGIFQKDLASYLSVSIGTISNYENGVHSPDLETLCKLAEYFDVSTDFLLQRTSYRYSLDTLNRKIAMDYTAADLLNTTLELNTQNRRCLVDYVELLQLRNKPDRDKKVSRASRKV